MSASVMTLEPTTRRTSAHPQQIRCKHMGYIRQGVIIELVHGICPGVGFDHGFNSFLFSDQATGGIHPFHIKPALRFGRH